MTDEVKDNLPELLKHITTLKKTSWDKEKKKYMCESKMKVINFDKIPKAYNRGKGWSILPKSNDALYIDVKGQWYFIEFKNGGINSGEIYKKLFDSIVMLLDEKIIPDIQFVRDNINYILVYNSNKYGKMANSPSREGIYGYVFERAEEEEKLFDIDKFEQYLFRETHTYTPSLFKKEFVLPKEREEGIAVEN